MNSAWNLVQERIRSGVDISGPKEALLREIKLIDLTETGLGNLARLSLNSKLSASMLERLLLPEIKRAFEAETGRATFFELEVASKQECFPVEQLVSDVFNDFAFEPAKNIASIRFRERLSLDPTMTFESFIKTNENRFGLEAVKEFSLFTPLSFSVLTLHGPAGVGKSHLLHSAGTHAKGVAPSTRVKIVTGDEFITDFQSAIAKKNMGDFKRRYRLETDLLLLDDLHSLCRAKATQEEFFNILNHFASTGRRLVITSDRDIQSLEGLEDRIKSRLSGGLVVPMSHPTELARRDILTLKLESENIRLDNALISEIAQKAGPCIRSLEGIVNTLVMFSRSSCLNRETIGHIVSGMRKVEVKPTPVQIMTQVAEDHSLSLDELRGRSRAKVHVEARRKSMRRLKEELGLSVSEIGRLHLRDHSTVLNALKAVRKSG